MDRRIRTGCPLLIAIASITFVAVSLHAQLVAEKITTGNASTRLFSGSHATGGVGDWYVSNGVVEAVIDDAAFNSDLAARGIIVPNQYLLSPTGGTLIDLALVGKNNDQLTQLFSVANISPQNVIFNTTVRAESGADAASIIADGFLIMEPFSNPTRPTLIARTAYTVRAGQPWLEVTTTVTNRGASTLPLFNITDVVPVIGSIIPFVPFPGRGFNHPPLILTPDAIAASLGVYPYVVLPGQVGPENGIIDTVTNAKAGEVSYGMVPGTLSIDPDGSGPLPPSPIPNPALLGLTTHVVVAVGNVFDPAKSPTLPAGGAFIYTRRVIVADRNDVASVTNGVYKSREQSVPIGVVTGNVDAEDRADVQATIIVNGRIPQLFGNTVVPITEVRTDEAGRFTLVLPQGDYTLTIFSPERSDATGIPLHVAAGTSAATLPRLSAAGSVSYRVTDGTAQIPSRLTFIGIGSPNPDFSRQYTSLIIDAKTGQRIGDAAAGALAGSPALNYINSGDGAGQQTIRPGKYRVMASRGLEYSIDAKEIEVKAGADTRVVLALRRVVDTTGWVSADFHIHSARSFDSSAPLEDRVRSYVAEGLEILVSTDHNFITDYAPILGGLRLNTFARSMVGNELTTFLPTPQFPQAWGHHNVFPVLVEPIAPRRGAILTEYVNGATMYDRARQKNPELRKTVQLNHPRAGILGFTTIGLFNAIQYNPTKPIPSILYDKSFLGTATTNLDFDALELYNGTSVGAFLQTRNDWFSLLDQGVIKTATAVSDSHKVVLETAGFPRSFVAAPTDDPQRVTDDMITDPIARRQVIGTSGPFIRFTIDDQPIGSLVRPKTWLGSRLEVRVSAPAWVPVSEVRIYANGRLWRRFDASTDPALLPAPSNALSTGGVQRFAARLRILPVRDTYYTVEAGVPLPDAVDTNGDGVIDTGDSNGDGRIDSRDSGIPQPVVGGMYADIVPGFAPIGFTNPIFVDRDGNGKFDAPGLDATRVRTLEIRGLKPSSDLEAALDHASALGVWQHLRIRDEDVIRFWISREAGSQ